MGALLKEMETMAHGAAVADPTGTEPGYDEARRLLATDRDRRADLGRRMRERARWYRMLAERWDRDADEVDPQPVPFEAVQRGDHVWLEDEWHRVLGKRTTEDEDGVSRALKVTRAHPAFYIPFHYEVADGELFTRGAF